MAQNNYEYQRTQNLAELAAQRGYTLDRIREILDAGFGPPRIVAEIRKLLERDA